MEVLLTLLAICLIVLGHLVYKQLYGYFKYQLKNIFKESPLRERLKMMYKIETDKAVYFAYNTQTIQKDWVNIEIERQTYGSAEIILEKEIFEDSWGAMGGDSFYSLMRSSRRHLIDYIKEKGEFILYESELS